MICGLRLIASSEASVNSESSKKSASFDACELCAELCSIRSETGDEKAIADFIELHLDSRWACERLGDNLWTHPKLNDNRPKIMLLGHLDTVPSSGSDLVPRIENGRLYGLGASDMKAGLAVMMALLATLDPDELPVRLECIFYTREEGPFLENGLNDLEARLRNSPPALAIFLEPTDNMAQLGCLGTLHAELTFEGRAAHSAKPWLVDNALYQMAPILQALSELTPTDIECEGFLYRETYAATICRGGEKRNVIPAHAMLNLNHRFAPSTSLAQAQEDVRALVQKFAPTAKIHFPDLCPSAWPQRHHPLVSQLIEMLDLSVEAFQAWTDVARLAALQIPALSFGPGSLSQAHQKGEFVELLSISKSLAGLQMFLKNVKF